MKINKFAIKNIIFGLVIILSLLHTCFHIHNLLNRQQPSYKPLFTQFLLLSSNMLVYDKPFGFFSELRITYKFTDNSPPVSFMYTENLGDSNNYLELFVKRRLQLLFNQKEIFNLLADYFFCKNNIKSFAKLNASNLIISELNFELIVKINDDKYKEIRRVIKCTQN